MNWASDKNNRRRKCRTSVKEELIGFDYGLIHGVKKKGEIKIDPSTQYLLIGWVKKSRCESFVIME